jgi:hypothetical protein
VKLLGMASHQRPMVDYASLVSLSNSSRIDAIKTIDQLSHRLSSSSRSSSGKSRQARSKCARSDSAARSRPRRPQPKSQENKRHSALEKPRHLPSLEDSEVSRSHNFPLQEQVKRQREGSPRSRQRTSLSRASSHSQRLSYLSTSSNSTKLGEIPSRRLRLKAELDEAGLDGPVLRPVYPLRPYAPPPSPERREGFIRRLFRRREMD